METINIEVWLYGPVAKYAGNDSSGSYAQLHLQVAPGSTVADLVSQLGIPPEEKGITFVNGSLAALPGLDSDHETELKAGDRVAISHRKSMWPFQYRFGASQTDDLRQSFRGRKDRGIHHAYTSDEE